MSPFESAEINELKTNISALGSQAHANTAALEALQKSLPPGTSRRFTSSVNFKSPLDGASDLFCR